MFNKKNKVKEITFGKNESDRTPKVEPKIHFQITYKTQLEIIQNDNQVIISDFETTITSDTELHMDPVMEYIDDAYANGYIRCKGGKEEYFTIISIKDIKKILYRPKFTMKRIEE